MNATGFLIVAFVLLVVNGAVMAVVMGRRGHSPYTWGLLGTMMGPLILPVVLIEVRHERRVGVSRSLGDRRGQVPSMF